MNIKYVQYVHPINNNIEISYLKEFDSCSTNKYFILFMYAEHGHTVEV